MKVQELIDALISFKEKHGDLPVKSEGDYYGIHRIELSDLDGTKKWAVLTEVYDDDLPEDEL